MKVDLETHMLFILLIAVTDSVADASLGQSALITSEKLLGMVTSTAREATRDCNEITFSDFSLTLYTRSNPTRGITLKQNTVSAVDLRKKTIIATHGWLSSTTSYLGPKMKEAYLKRYDCNLILLDWFEIAMKPYPTSVCLLPKIARLVANLLCEINNNQHGVSLRTIHLVGISLGGQLFGLVGQETKGICKQEIGRITAMDPAGPLFQNLPEDQRVDKSDAVFVDVIHTNQGALGYFGNCGHVDFYPNCGILQNGCPKVDAVEAAKFPLLIVACDHIRSFDYMYESITSNNFKAKSCKSCPENCRPDNFNAAEAIMGEGCSTNTSSGAYVLQTNAEAPFAMG